MRQIAPVKQKCHIRFGDGLNAAKYDYKSGRSRQKWLICGG